MPFQLDNWRWILLLPPLLAYVWWISGHSLSDLEPRRRRLALAVRSFLFTLLLLALAGLEWVHNTDRLAVMFVVDGSRSIPSSQRNVIEKYLKTADANMHPADSIGLLTFAQQAHIQSEPGRSLDTSRIRDPGPNDATNIADALRTARTLLDTVPGKPGKRIVLLSDGNENEGHALGALSDLEADDIHLDTVALSDGLTNEAMVDRLVIPPRVKIGEPFTVRAVISSLTSQTGSVLLTRDGQPAAPSKSVPLHPGKTLVIFSQTVTHPGFYRYSLNLTAPQDTIPDNNTGSGFVWVRGKPTLLYVADSPALTGFLQKTLQSEDIKVEYAQPSALPSNPAALQRYDSIFLSNVPAVFLTDAQMRTLQIACRDFGIGLGMVGGDYSFGAGYYRGTPLEKALPVSMDVKKQKRLPSVAVALVIEDLEIPSSVNMSIESAKAVVDLLEPIDQLGVLDCNGFDYSNPSSASAGGSWRIPMQHVTDPDALKAQMQNLTGMGDPPSYTPYLLQAAQTLNATDAKVKHIIFLGDGDAVYEQNQSAVPNAIRKIAAMGITLSTISTGADASGKRFMAAIAALGNGQAYVADQPEQLPRLLLKDQATFSQPPIIEEPFHPTPVETNGPLKGIDWSTAPPLLGYDVTSLKPSATPGLMDASPDRDNPVFASWRYGLGRSVAFMSDDRAHWAALWLNWPGYARFWAQTVRWTMRPSHSGDYDTQVQMEDGRGHITINAIDHQGKFVDGLQMRAIVAPPDRGGLHGGKTHQVTIRQTGPGRYEGWFDAPSTGTYMVNVLQKPLNGSGPEISTPVGLSIPYSAEYRDIHANRYLLTQLAQVGGGRVNPSPRAVFGSDRPEERAGQPMQMALLAMAALLLPFDIAVRRLAIGREDFHRASVWLRARFNRSKAVENEQMTRLKARKQAAGEGLQAAQLKNPREPIATAPLPGIFQPPPSFNPDSTGKTDASANDEALEEIAQAPNPDDNRLARLRAAKLRANQAEEPESEKS